MAVDANLQCSLRESLGSRASRKLRAGGRIPASLQGEDIDNSRARQSASDGSDDDAGPSDSAPVRERVEAIERHIGRAQSEGRRPERDRSRSPHGA